MGSTPIRHFMLPRTKVTTCPKCGLPMETKKGSFGSFRGCTAWPECDVTQSLAKNCSPVDQELREARKLTHDVFDRLWKNPNQIMSRNEAYKYLSVNLKTKPADTHIGLFTLHECTETIHWVADLLRRYKKL